MQKPEHRASILIIIPSPEQWTGKSMHQTYEGNTKML